MAILLADDGTLDTVFQCSECSKQFRYQYEPWGLDLTGEGGDYEDFVDETFDRIREGHQCDDAENDDC